MKRLCTIAFLIIFLFNVIGYHGLFWLTRNQFRADLIQQLDRGNYAEDQTVILKIPISLPYHLGAPAEYERVNGDFEHQGEFYKLVKQKLTADTLYVICIKDRTEKRLTDAMVDFVKATNDLPTTSKTLKLLSSFVKDFNVSSAIEIERTSGWFEHATYPAIQYHTLAGMDTCPALPPELLS